MHFLSQIHSWCSAASKVFVVVVKVAASLATRTDDMFWILIFYFIRIASVTVSEAPCKCWPLLALTFLLDLSGFEASIIEEKIWYYCLCYIINSLGCRHSLCTLNLFAHCVFKNLLVFLHKVIFFRSFICAAFVLCYFWYFQNTGNCGMLTSALTAENIVCTVCL